ncbi:MAG: 16S rRNA (cytosine(967)-C(5))-methyltransferase RsmB [Sedimentibacter sp.]|uniref:16S rRNA (cytosine(967)-C(5))-methyltransferase RsmB n=1 Tax=Sedimentibacter sp. TaxID=1960295 RepID=UPI0029812A01|nr:16S rRNA (cytosine(967)-C(5))-methyltransferase RsmB [Sedimentibacter sp.]MDW5300565.1 16S rRNA (cytosine(967)-C(5))-methyltransferase RsmB [Sedimentibacter sp.]
MDTGYRAQVIETIKKIFKDKSYSNIVINNNIKNVDVRHQALFRKSVFGVIEYVIFIDWIIDEMSKTKTKKMELDVLAVLRLAVYQIFFLDNSYENIVVNESVQYIKDKGNLRTSKFINAVLRNIIRNKIELLSRMKTLSTDEYLSVKYSYPKELVKKWKEQFGKDIIEDVLIANNSEASLEVRVNVLKISRDDLIELFNKKGIVSNKCKYSTKGLIISNSFEIDKTEEYKNGLFSIQSESSMLAGQILNPRENSLIIDMCAAPGGKSLNAAEIMNNTGKIISRDIYPGKLSLIEKEKKRLGIKNLVVEPYDATKLDESLIEKADYCIVDVPCTGLGIIRRKPEIKYKKTEEDRGIVDIQYKIIENASKYLKHNGELVYSTCTTNKEENIDIVMKFIKNNKGFALSDISENVDDIFPTAKDGYIEIYPHINGMDGFFIAKMQRL